MMDSAKLSDIFKATIDPNQRETAEKQLEQIHKIIGFGPRVLQLVMDNTMDMPIRQAAAIYLKNQIISFWADKEPNQSSSELMFAIHEQDRGMIREAIVDSIVHAPDTLRVHLAVCINHIVKNDFPGRWTGIVDKIVVYIQTPDPTIWMGSFVSLHQLVKNFEYKNNEDRTPLVEAMKLILPLTYNCMVHLMPDATEQSVLLQKQILKIFHALVQYSFPLSLLTKDVFTQWMEIFRQILDRPVPQETNQIDADERPELSWWKVKKWAVHILARVFERYGSPGRVQKEYREFSEWFLKSFSLGIIQAMLKILDQYGNKIYVTPRVLQQAINYLNTAVNHSFSWKLIKTHMPLIIQNILFQLMCYTDEDDELWTTDPIEYIRIKFDVFEDYVSPVSAAQTLLHTVCKKRKDMLPKTTGFAMHILSNVNNDPRIMDGALHMIGSVADILLKKDEYKTQMESMLVSYVFPYFQSQFGYLRARACWVLHYFEDIRFSNESNLIQALSYLQNCLLNDNELPVKVEAAMSLQVLVSSQDKAEPIVEPNIAQITLEILKVIRETENEDLTNVLQKFVCRYSEKLAPIAFEMTQHLAHTFTHVMLQSDDDDSNDKALAAMGILNTIDTILTMLDEQKEIIQQLEPIVLQIIVGILNEEMMELYEEGFNLISSITTNYVSNEMWKIFELIYKAFNNDGFDYFTDMMPALHNFVTVDPNGFVSNQNHVIAIYEMCKKIMNSDAGEEAECHAAKILEVIILQFKGKIDHFIPMFVELVLVRLSKKMNSDDLRTICLQVIIAALYYNPDLLLEILGKLQINANQSLVNHFISQWIADIHCFSGLHDRKMCVLGLCTLMNMNPNQRPAIINEIAAQIIPSALLLFDGLKEAYKSKAEEDNESEGTIEESDSDESETGDLDDDEDHVICSEYHRGLLRTLNRDCPFPVTSATVMDDDDDESDIGTDTDDEEDFELTALESYTTAIDDQDSPDDEYVVFKELLEQIQHTDPNWYNVLVSQLNAQQQKSIQEVYTLALQRKAAAESRKIEKSGGYVFANQNVPMSFNFGGSPLS